MKDNEKHTNNLLGDRLSMQSTIQELKSITRIIWWAGAWDHQGIKNKNVVQHLIKALNDTDPDVRVTAATVLGWMREEKAVEPLIKILKDNVDEVRLAAIEALGEIGDGKAADSLAMRFENEDVGAATWVAALRSLTKIYLKYSSNQ